MLRNPNSFTRRLGFRQMSITRGGGSGGSRLLSRKLIQLFFFVAAFSLLFYFQSSLHIRISVPRSRQDLVRRLSNPAKLGARIHSSRKVPQIYATGKAVSDDWDWDETDPYDRHYAAVIEEEEALKGGK